MLAGEREELPDAGAREAVQRAGFGARVAGQEEEGDGGEARVDCGEGADEVAELDVFAEVGLFGAVVGVVEGDEGGPVGAASAAAADAVDHAEADAQDQVLVECSA